MKRYAFILLILFSSQSLQTQELSEVIGWGSGLFEPDENAGSTTFRLLLIPSGGEREGMATAYTAVARDASYLEANPAASSMLEYTELSFLHNNWIADSSVESVYYTIRNGNIGLGAGGKILYVPFRAYDTWGEPVSKGFFSEGVGMLNASYNFLSNFHFSGIAVGGTLKTAYRYVSTDISPGQSFVGVMADLGILTRFDLLKFFAYRGRNAAAGIALKNVGPPAGGDPLPAMLTFGVAYMPIRPLTLSFDYSIPLILFTDDPPEQHQMAGGFSLAFTEFFSLQGGILLKGANPRLTIGGNLRTGSIGITTNYTLDLTTQLHTLDRLSVEAKLNLGDQGRGELRSQVEELYLLSLEAFAKGDLEETIRRSRNAIELDPGFLPARETFETASRSLELQAQMERLQTIEQGAIEQRAVEANEDDEAAQP